MSDLLAGLAEWVIGVVDYFGYAGVFVLVALGNLHLPIPTQLTLPLAGFLVGQGRFSFVPALAWSTASAVVTSLVMYLPGLWTSEEGLHRLVGKVERFKLVFRSDLTKTLDMFERHGGKAVFLGHLVPGIGAFISIPAGLKRMRVFGWFMVYTVLGCALWNGIFIGLGWALGAHWEVVERYARIIEYAVLAAAAAGVAWFLWRRWRTHRGGD